MKTRGRGGREGGKRKTVKKVLKKRKGRGKTWLAQKGQNGP